MLTEVGFLASARGDARRAEAIFGALELARPQGTFPYVGLAMAYLNTNRAEDAVQALDRGLAAAGPAEHAELEAFRGLALQLAGRSSESLRAIKAGQSNRLAQAMLGQGTMHPKD